LTAVCGDNPSFDARRAGGLGAPDGVARRLIRGLSLNDRHLAGAETHGGNDDESR
jgi:hypothetical protein